MNEKEWVKILRALGNEKRLKILKLLAAGDAFPVFAISERINLGFKSTSKHLARFAHLGILDSEGKGKRVEYSMSPAVKPAVRRILKEIFS